VESWAYPGASIGPFRPLVEWRMRSGRHDRAVMPDAFARLVPAIAKAVINAVSMQSRGFIKNFRLQPMVGCFALKSDCSLGIFERQPNDRQIDQAA
jgi:hypothetical protein